MKRLKRIMALVIAMAMVLGMMSMTAFAGETEPIGGGTSGAAETDTGSITIKSPVMGASYTGYRVFDLVMSESGDAFSYSIEKPSPFFNAVMKYANMPEEGEDADADGLTLTVAADTVGKTPEVYSVTATENFDAQEFGKFLETCITHSDEDHPAVTGATEYIPTYEEGKDVITVATSTEVTFNGKPESNDEKKLPLGYYLILSEYPQATATVTLGEGENQQTINITEQMSDADIAEAVNDYVTATVTDDYVDQYIEDNDLKAKKEAEGGTWTDADWDAVKEELISSLTEDAMAKVKDAIASAPDLADINVQTSRLVFIDSTTPDADIFEKNEIDKWDVPVNPEGSANVEGLPDHDEPKGGKNIIIGYTGEGENRKPIYGDTTEANIGDSIDYELRINAMNFIQDTESEGEKPQQVKEYVIADYENKNMTFDSSKGLKVSVVNDAGTVLAGPIDYTAWSNYFFMNDSHVDLPEGDEVLTSAGGGIVVPWVGKTDNEATAKARKVYTKTEELLYTGEGEDKKPVYKTEAIKTEKNENNQDVQVPARDGNGDVIEGRYMSVNGNVVDAEGCVRDANDVKVQDSKTWYIYSLYPSDVTIVVNYSMILKDTAVIDGDGNVNYAQFGANTVKPEDYSWEPANPGTPPNTPPGKPDVIKEKDDATVYTYALAFKKVNDEGANLADAEFLLPFYVKKDKAADGAYIYAFDELPAEFPTGDSAENYTNKLTTPANGEITIKGIQQTDTTPTNDNLKREYEFTETKAPDGYNKLAGSFKVTAQKTGETVTTETVRTKYLDENGNVVEEKSATTVTVTYETGANVPVYEYQLVINKKGTELPSTGGIGTTIFYVIGTILVLGAGVVLITRRRMDA